MPSHQKVRANKWCNYVDLAHKNGLTPVQLALGFVRSRWFVTSVIIAASTLEQLQENLSCVDIELSPEILEHSEAINRPN